MSLTTGSFTSLQFQHDGWEIDSDGLICPPDFEPLISRFADALENEGLAKSTCRAYVSDARQFADWIHVNGFIHSFDQPELAENFIGFLCKANRNNASPHQHPYSVSTIRRRICGATRFMDFLLDIELIPANLFNAIPRINLGHLQGGLKVHIIPKGKILGIISICDLSTAAGLRDRALLLAIAGVGLSVSEVHKIDVTDVNFGDCSLSVHGRGGRPRTLPLPPPLINSFKRWITARTIFASGSNALIISLHNNSGRGEPGRRLSRRSIRKVVDRHLELIGEKTPGVSCHALRQSAILHNFSYGADFKGIRSMYGLTPKTIRAYQKYASEICQNRVLEREK